MLDSDLARLYHVDVGALNRAVKRNSIRFPPDFMFRLTRDEANASRCQLGILKAKRGGNLKYLPYAFTEQGVAMLSSVLKSPRAALVNIAIMRAFVRLREPFILREDLLERLKLFEDRLSGHDRELGSKSQEIREIFEALRQLTSPVSVPRPRIGFKP